MPSFNVARLDKKISEDIPDINAVLKALAKWDVSGFTDIPDGSLRMTLDVKNQGTIEKYSGSWSPVTKLMHDVDKLDGYHASTSASANTIVVRDKNGAIPGNILGNAATATKAGGFSNGVTLPVSQGGTGATTASQARTNLDVPPTSHASSGTAYGLGSNLNYGHVRGDGETTDVIAGEIVVKDVLFNNISLTSSGLLGKAKYIFPSQPFNIDTDDFDLILINSVSENTSGTLPNFSGFLYIRQYYYTRISPTAIGARMQVAFAFDANKMWRRYLLNNKWSSWVKVIDETDFATTTTPGIVKPGTGMTVGTNGALNVDTASTSKKGIVQLNNTVTSTSSTQAATANAVKTAYDKAVDAEAAIANALSVGALLPSFAASMSGYLLCNGAAVSRTTYADLFAILGTAFGAGDGSKTFNLPDFRDKTFWGANGNLMKVLAAGLPNLSGMFWAYTVGWSNASGTGAFYDAGAASGTPGNRGGEGGTACRWGCDASRSNKIYGRSTTVQPPAITVNIFIKY